MREIMPIMPTVIIILAIGVFFLIFFTIKNVILPRKALAAENLLNRSKILQAVRTAKEAVEKDPKSAEAHFILGKAYLADKRDEQAFREFRSVSRLGIEGKNIPEMEFRETLAGLYARFHEEEEALKEYIFLIKNHPDNPDYYYRAGKLFSSRNRGDLAIQYLRKAVSLNPKEQSYRMELGMHYYLTKRIKEAGGEFEAVLKLNPAEGQALLYLGKAHKETKDYNGAIPYLEKASWDHEYKLRALVELGGCYMSLKMTDKAIPELERAVNVIKNEAEPDSLYARYFLGLCFEKNREYAKAIAQWEKINTQKKNFRDVKEKLSQYSKHKIDTPEKNNSGKS